MVEPSVKYRHEFKYLISEQQLCILKNRLMAIVPIDKNVGEDGKYNIRSVYFDGYYNSCFYENLSGVDPREKFRIRIYNHLDARISLECKRKEHGKTLKTSCLLSRAQCDKLLNKQYPLDLIDKSPVSNKLIVKMMNRLMRPVIIVDYDRVPFVYKNGNVRITLDTNIASSTAIDSFFDGSIVKRPVLPVGMQLLEVKYDEYLPDYIYQMLQLDDLQQTTFSKYFLCRKYSLKGAV